MVSCRLFVYLARRAPIGVVLRRGPTDWARLSLWHTDTDRIEHGQWIKARVYERRSDLSADGRLFAAFVRQSAGRNAEGADSWIALSRPPYFTALAVWYVGGTYHTGAFFPEDDTLWLGFMKEAPPDVGTRPPSLHIAPPQPIRYVDGTGEWTERTVHFNRLLRDGWLLIDREPYATLWKRLHPDGTMALSMVHVLENFRRFGGPYSVDYAVTTAAGTEHALGEATWADWDHRGRLVAARDGQLSEWSVPGGWRVIEDFNGQEPDPRPAPDRARSIDDF
jgi:YD repeat-containing protein